MGSGPNGLFFQSAANSASTSAISIGASVTLGSNGAVLCVATSSTLQQSAVGTSGRALVSGGTGVPTWFNPSFGAIIYGASNGDLAASAVGTSGRAFVSGGAGAPSWFNPGAGTVIYGGSNGELTASAVGTSGRGLISGGTGAPTWFNPGSGTVIYGGSNGELTASAAGTSGRGLVSGGTGAPTWFNPSAGAILYAASNGELTASSIGASGQALISGGTGAPSWLTMATGSFTGNATASSNVIGTPSITDGYYIRNGDIVTFAIVVSIDPDAASTATSVDFTPPVASNFSAGSDASGTLDVDAGCPYNLSKGSIFAVAATDKIRLSFVPGGNSAETYYAHGMYRVR